MSKPNYRNYKGVTYWETLSGAAHYACKHSLGYKPIRKYDRGYAIQLRISGPYVCVGNDPENENGWRF
jgi:hypothetical protein